MSGIRFEVIEEPERLASLTPQWWDLWRRSASALPFQAPVWLLAWWRHFAPGKLLTLAAFRDERLVALAPGYIEDGALGRRILPLGISLSDHLDVLADPDCADEALQALASAALSRRDEWDAWELEELAPGAVALAMPLPQGCLDRVDPQTACPVISVGGNPYAFPRAKRRQYNLARNRAARRGVVAIHGPDLNSAPAALEHLFRLHRLRWESRGGTGVLAPDEVQAFQREATSHLEAAGLLRLYTLAIAGQVVAAHYELVHGPRTSIYLTGFDPAFEYESPSVILMAHAIEQALAKGAREIDFLRGQEAYKYEWGAVDRWNVKRSIRHSAHG